MKELLFLFDRHFRIFISICLFIEDSLWFDFQSLDKKYVYVSSSLQKRKIQFKACLH